MAEAPAPRRGAGSLRARITSGATAIVGVALFAGAVVFFVLVRGALLTEVRVTVEGDVAELAAQLEGPGALPGAGGDDDDRFFQLVSATGEVLSAGGSAPAAAPEIPGPGEYVRVRLPDEDEAFLIAAQSLDGGATVVAGRSLDDVGDALDVVGGLLGAAVPLLILLVGLSIWVVVGRALAPVERMRREVDEVSATRLDRRVADSGRSDEIGRLARTMNDMLDRLDRSQRAQRQFVSDASHELKSPLASLRQYAEVARSHPDRVGTADLSAAVLDEGARLERLVQGMLVLARAGERSAPASNEEIDLDDLLLHEARRLRDSTSLAVDTSRVGPARTHGDQGLLEQVVRNLVDNAARHAVARVVFSLRAVGGAAVLGVEDDGPGIPPEQRERVFDRFVRLDEARARDSGGSGLGLSIVREIVRLHGGAVSISESGLGGAHVEVRLPLGGLPGS